MEKIRDLIAAESLSVISTCLRHIGAITKGLITTVQKLWSEEVCVSVPVIPPLNITFLILRILIKKTFAFVLLVMSLTLAASAGAVDFYRR